MEDDPLAKIGAWLDEAQTLSSRRNPLAMALATCSEEGVPAVRMVLAKGLCRTTGHVVFYTHFNSRKGSELTAVPRAAAVWYWEEFGGRQLRIEGSVTRSPDSESDAYFATRPAGSQINAWVSRQSQTLEPGDSLESSAAQKAQTLSLSQAALAQPAEIPRPAHWGGFRLWIERVEFWSEGAGRFHEREFYERTAAPGENADNALRWRMKRLQP